MATFPTLFVSHGAPTFALHPGEAGGMLQRLGEAFGRPRAVVVVSPHWSTRGVMVGASARPRTIHDFGGFPDALYRLSYPAPGDPGVAQEVRSALHAAGCDAQLIPEQGLDHGVWVPMRYLYPQADVPTVPLSLPIATGEAELVRMGRALSHLRQRGILVVGSGSLTHNLYEFRGPPGEATARYAIEFVDWFRDTITSGHAEGMLDWRSRAPHAARAHPTDEHLMPLFVAWGAAGAPARGLHLDGGFAHGVLSMSGFLFP